MGLRTPWSEDGLKRLLGQDVLGSGLSAVQLVERYFGPFVERRTSDDGDPVGYSGKYFDTISLGRLDETLSLGELDLVAVSNLSIRVDGGMFGSLIAIAPRVEESLSSVAGLSRRSQMWGAENADLWNSKGLREALDHFRSLSNFGETTSRKLMAAMFPHLLPVRDRVVERVMEPVGRTGWWNSWRLVCGPSLEKHLVEIRSGARERNPEVPAELSLLRVADIAIWTAVNVVSKRQRAEIDRTSG